MANRTCCECGRPATVQAYSGSEEGKERTIRDYCEECAQDPLTLGNDASSDGNIRSVTGGLLLTSGAILGFLGVFADHLGISGNAGFGWHQSVGLCTGLLLALLGSVFRVNLIAVIGFALLGLSVAADVLEVGRTPGLGRRQTAAMIIASALLASGCWLRHRRKRNST